MLMLHTRRIQRIIIMNSTTIEYTDPYPFEDFAPTLSQCFVLVIVGYLLSKFEILTASDVKGVISLANYFAIPGIICVSLMNADFSDFRWELLFGIFLGKFFTFVLVAGFWTMLKGNVGVAGALALFCTQSNDLPVGLPLISSLYEDYRPKLMTIYLFFTTAMTVIIFVPASNIILNAHREKQKRIKMDDSLASIKRWWEYVQKEDILNQIRETAKNPVVIATVCGLVLNFALEAAAPETFQRPIKVAAATIPGIALVMLGFSFVRKERYLLSSAVIPAAMLLILKMVITPIMLNLILKMLTEESKSSKFLSDFALLYGIVSPSTTIFLSGREFRKALSVMSVALILSSFTCFPVSYIVARATIAPVHKLSTYVPILRRILFWTACFSICCDVITAIIIIAKNQWQQVSSYILYLLFTQVITCCGLILWSLTKQQTGITYYQMVLYYGGEISGYLWAGVMAVLLVFRHNNWMLAKKGSFIISCTALSVSAIITTVMCLLISYNDVQTVYVVARARSNFEYLQLIMTSILLFISLVIVTACLTCHFKNSEKIESKITEASAYINTVFYVDDHLEKTQAENSRELSWADKVQEETKEQVESDSSTEEILQKSSFKSWTAVDERDWTFRLSSLLILSGLVMLVRFIANLYKLVRSNSLEVMIPLEFLQSTLFIGQGIFILLTFGIDVRIVTISLRKWCRKLLHGDDADIKDSNTKDEGQIKLFCHQFYKFYYNRCFTDISNERRWKNNVYKDSFWGHQLVDWLISEGLCQDDVDAEIQGQKLLEGGVIKHITRKHHFYDAPFLYQFVKRSFNSESYGKF